MRRPFAAIGPYRPLRLPPHARGMTIGLYGGSFNPPHAGHRLVADSALRALRLDRIWWLVTPGNPLKNNSGLASLAGRMAACKALVRDPAHVVTAFEADLGIRYTVDLIRFLTRRCVGVKFVWIMGGDSLAGFHRWKDWQDIAALVPLAIVDRPGKTLAATAGKAAQRLKLARWSEPAAPRLARARPPAWVLLYGPRSNLSSTALRRQAGEAENPSN